MRIIASLAGALLALVFAFQSSANEIIYACVIDSSGRIRIVNSAVNCESSEIPLSWNRVGPPGPPGPPGEPGPEGPPGPLLVGPPTAFPIAITAASSVARLYVQWAASAQRTDELNGSGTSTLPFSFDLGGQPNRGSITGITTVAVTVSGSEILFDQSGQVAFPTTACCAGLIFETSADLDIHFVVPHFGSPITPVIIRLVEVSAPPSSFSSMQLTNSGEAISSSLGGTLQELGTLDLTKRPFAMLNLLAGDEVTFLVRGLGSLVRSPAPGSHSFTRSFKLELYAVGPSDAVIP